MYPPKPFDRYILPNEPLNQLGLSFIKEDNDTLKYQKIHNPQCTQQMEKQVTTADLTLFTSNSIRSVGGPKLNLRIGPQEVDYMDFVKQGWKSELGKPREVFAPQIGAWEMDLGMICRSRRP